MTLEATADGWNWFWQKVIRIYPLWEGAGVPFAYAGRNQMEDSGELLGTAFWSADAEKPIVNFPDEGGIADFDHTNDPLELIQDRQDFSVLFYGSISNQETRVSKRLMQHTERDRTAWGFLYGPDSGREPRTIHFMLRDSGASQISYGIEGFNDGQPHVFIGTAEYFSGLGAWETITYIDNEESIDTRNYGGMSDGEFGHLTFGGRLTGSRIVGTASCGYVFNGVLTEAERRQLTADPLGPLRSRPGITMPLFAGDSSAPPVDITAQTATVNVAGQNASIVTDIAINATPAVVNVTGQNASLGVGVAINATPAEINVFGVAATIATNVIIDAVPAVLLASGQRASLVGPERDQYPTRVLTAPDRMLELKTTEREFELSSAVRDFELTGDKTDGNR